MGKEVLRLENIAKSFSDNYVLRDIDFSLAEGEVRALVGENGAGKSTMIKIISGALEASGGSIYLGGNQVRFSSPKESLLSGISVMYQELDLLPELTVVENVYLGIEEKNRFGMLDRRPMNETVDDYLREMNLTIDKNAKVKTLPIVLQQMVAAIKAMVHQAKIVIMDEPSSSLTSRELQILFDLIRRLRRQNIAVLYVSHRLEEIFEICDSVTVLLNGKIVSTTAISQTTRQKVIEEMVGREVVETRLNPRDRYDAPALLEAKELSSGDLLQSVSFEVKQGEIFGILGLVGSGAVELGKLLYGIKRPTGGGLKIRGKPVALRTPSDALRHSISYVSDDRRAFGILREMDVEKNGMISSLERYLTFRPLRLMDKQKISKVFAEYVQRLEVKITGADQKIRLLSGGNQQKVLIARWLLLSPEILFLDEPTRGIDVHSKSEIYRVMNELAKQGTAIVMISSEMPELLGMSDNILVMCEGRITGQLSIGEATQHKLLMLAMGESVDTEDNVQSAQKERMIPTCR